MTMTNYMSNIPRHVAIHENGRFGTAPTSVNESGISQLAGKKWRHIAAA